MGHGPIEGEREGLHVIDITDYVAWPTEKG